MYIKDYEQLFSQSYNVKQTKLWPQPNVMFGFINNLVLFGIRISTSNLIIKIIKMWIGTSYDLMFKVKER